MVTKKELAKRLRDARHSVSSARSKLKEQKENLKSIKIPSISGKFGKRVQSKKEKLQIQNLQRQRGEALQDLDDESQRVDEFENTQVRPAQDFFRRDAESRGEDREVAHIRESTLGSVDEDKREEQEDILQSQGFFPDLDDKQLKERAEFIEKFKESSVGTGARGGTLINTPDGVKEVFVQKSPRGNLVATEILSSPQSSQIGEGIVGGENVSPSSEFFGDTPPQTREGFVERVLTQDDSRGFTPETLGQTPEDFQGTQDFRGTDKLFISQRVVGDFRGAEVRENIIINEQGNFVRSANQDETNLIRNIQKDLVASEETPLGKGFRKIRFSDTSKNIGKTLSTANLNLGRINQEVATFTTIPTLKFLSSVGLTEEKLISTSTLGAFGDVPVGRVIEKEINTFLLDDAKNNPATNLALFQVGRGVGKGVGFLGIGATTIKGLTRFGKVRRTSGRVLTAGLFSLTALQLEKGYREGGLDFSQGIPSEQSFGTATRITLPLVKDIALFTSGFSFGRSSVKKPLFPKIQVGVKPSTKATSIGLSVQDINTGKQLSSFRITSFTSGQQGKIITLGDVLKSSPKGFLQAGKKKSFSQLAFDDAKLLEFSKPKIIVSGIPPTRSDGGLLDDTILVTKRNNRIDVDTFVGSSGRVTKNIKTISPKDLTPIQEQQVKSAVENLINSPVNTQRALKLLEKRAEIIGIGEIESRTILRGGSKTKDATDLKKINQPIKRTSTLTFSKEISSKSIGEGVTQDIFESITVGKDVTKPFSRAGQGKLPVITGKDIIITKNIQPIKFSEIFQKRFGKGISPQKSSSELQQELNLKSLQNLNDLRSVAITKVFPKIPTPSRKNILKKSGIVETSTTQLGSRVSPLTTTQTTRQITSSKLIPKLKEITKVSSISGVRSIQKPLTKELTKTIQKEITKSLTKQVPKVAQKSISKQITKSIQKLTPKTTTRTTPRNIINPQLRLPTKKIIPPLFKSKKFKSTKTSRKKKKGEDDLFFIPSFTAKTLGIKRPISDKELRRISKRGFSGVELRAIPI